MLLSRALCLLALAACGGPPAAVALSGLDGGRYAPQQVPPGHVHVIVYTSPECPIANRYAPTLRGLVERWQALPVTLFVVYVAPGLDVGAVVAHRHAFDLPGTILLDPAQELAVALGVTRTPETVVLSERGLVYRGRIDDEWRGVGARGSGAVHHDLRDAVDTALRGGVVPPPHPDAVGCLLPEPKAEHR